MKAWKQAAIVACICAGILVSPSIMKAVQDSQAPANRPPQRVVTDSEWNALSAYARLMMSRTSVVNDTATGFDLVAFQTGPLGIMAQGYYVEPDNPAAAAIVDQYLVNLSGLASGTSFTDKNAVIDKAHNCVIFYHVGAYIALVIH